MRRRSIREEDLADLHGKVVLVTGGNTGIGYATIQMIARRGAKVYMGARNGARAAEAIERLKMENIGDGSVHWLELDLSDPRLASRAGMELIQQEERLDILINNAGLQSNKTPFKLTTDGLLDIMVVNYISHFVLTETLLPLMKRTAAEDGSDVRIVNVRASRLVPPPAKGNATQVTSYAHAEVAPETFSTKDAVNKDFGATVMGKFRTYGNTKLANILHIKELQTRLDAEGVRITCLASHPGVITTAGTEGAMGAVPLLGWFLTGVVARLFFKSWRVGAMPVAFAAAGPEVVGTQHAKYKGAYLTPMDVIATPSESARDSRLQKELHDTTARIVQELGL
ncbi:NAD-P-binding protein [Mycena metata]|uniref:NAD-P-binding protein n=1 Tax=Mycena metata TaxID=1033252 RepID=A0AAD7HZ44_9AGAR|nr:NAD-P-binding protein [Mycena metata]